jgi:hypothetical protein
MPGESARRNGRLGGRPKGSLAKTTLDKIAAREELRRQVIDAMGPMVRAQVAHAQGIGHLYKRDEGGKFTRIEDINEIDRMLREEQEGSGYWIFAKDPSVQAFTDLMNRALDKPTEVVEMSGRDGGPLVVKWET